MVQFVGGSGGSVVTRGSRSPNPERLQGGPYPVASVAARGPGTPGVARSAGPAVAGPGGPGRKLTPAQRRQQAVAKLQAALKKAGVNPLAYHGGPWSIFTHGGGPQVAKLWATELLRTIGAPVSPGNVAMVYNWEVSEGGGGKYNPLNQGPVPGQPSLTTTGQQYGGGAADFASWQAGIEGSAAYLNMPAFAGVRNALKANDPAAARAALISSPWAASHYGWGSGFSNQPVPGGSIPALPPLPATRGTGTGGSVASRLTGPTGGTGRAGTSTGGPPAQQSGVQVGPDPQASARTAGIVTTAQAGSPPQPGGTGSNPILFPFVEGFDLTKEAFTSAQSAGTALTAVSNNFRAFLSGIDWLFIPSHWVRLAAFFGGFASVGTGIVLLGFTGGRGRPAALPLGIASVGFGGILLFVAFHNLPSDVRSLPDAASWLADQIHGGSTAAGTAGTVAAA